MMEEKKREIGVYLVGMLKAVLNNAQPEEKPNSFSFEELYSFAKFHSVQCMAYYAVEKLAVQPDDEKNRKWKSERDQNIIKSFIQLEQRDAVIKAVTNAGINLLPVKGCLIKEMYPQPDYRQMADLDILFDRTKGLQTREIMESMGYKTTYFAYSNHDVYEKKPVMSIEMHRDLFAENYSYSSYYKNVWDKAIADSNNEHLYHLSWNDFYVHLLAHFAKHYFNGGSGIRSVMDIHIFLKCHRCDLDYEYIDNELNAMGIREFKETAEALARCWFEDEKQTEKTREMEEYVFTSGAYGVYLRYVENNVKKAKEEGTWKGTGNYMLKRLFLPYSKMCSRYPVLKKLPVLLPLFWVIRVFSALLHSTSRIRSEIDIINKD